MILPERSTASHTAVDRACLNGGRGGTPPWPFQVARGNSMFRSILLCCMLASASDSAVAAEAAAGNHKAAMCAVCHGLNGLARNPDAPNLAGDSVNYLTKQLAAFKSGAR